LMYAVIRITEVFFSCLLNMKEGRENVDELWEVTQFEGDRNIFLLGCSQAMSIRPCGRDAFEKA
jgi:hypothetical protein